MTKQHFEFVASLINAASKGVDANHIATMAAAKFSKDNPRFDEGKFLAACGTHEPHELQPARDPMLGRDGDYWEQLVLRAASKPDVKS